MPEWLFWLWIGLGIPFSFIGEGMLSFLLVRLVYNSWFATPDASAIEIQLLKQHLESCINEKKSLEEQNSKLLFTIAENSRS